MIIVSSEKTVYLKMAVVEYNILCILIILHTQIFEEKNLIYPLHKLYMCPNSKLAFIRVWEDSGLKIKPLKINEK
jgi:hypothetical protein